MASASPPPAGVPTGPAAGTWNAHFTQEGRPYWNHSITKESVWEKPRELKTQIELEMEATNWVEYSTGGKPYWVHNQSKETTWEMPKEIRDILDNQSAPPAPAPHSAPHQHLPTQNSPTHAPAFVPQQQQHNQHNQHQGSPLGSSTPTFPNSSNSTPIPSGPRHSQPSLPQRPNVPMPAGHSLPDRLPDFKTFEEAEGAFMVMLKKIGVSPDWTWERTMREAITEPLYKALRTLAERKAAFEKYQRKEKDRIEAERKERLDGVREQWNKGMEKLNGGKDKDNGVKSWWDWPSRKAEVQAGMSSVWALLQDDSERNKLFDDYLADLRTHEQRVKAETRTASMAKLSTTLRSLQLDLSGPLRWRDAHQLILRTPDWQHSAQLQKTDPVDILTVFEEEVRLADRDAAEARARRTTDKRREARKARERFDGLLQQLEEEGVLTAGAKWRELCPRLAGEEAYLGLLGHAGSSPIELFWDRVDRLDQEAERDLIVVERALKRKGYEVTETSSLTEFEEAVQGADGIEPLTQRFLRSAFDKLQVRAVRQAKEERRRHERQLRLEIDDLRYAYKKLDPPVELEETYEQVLPRIRDTPEFIALKDEEARRTAFDKFIRRQKEKAKDRERELARAKEDEEYARAAAAKRSAAAAAVSPGGQPQKRARMTAAALMDGEGDVAMDYDSAEEHVTKPQLSQAEHAA